VEWWQGNQSLLTIEQHDQQLLLESALSRILLIDLATCPELASPYVRYIFDNYFANLSDQVRVSEALGYIESLGLDHGQANQVKLLVLLHSGSVWIYLWSYVELWRSFPAERTYLSHPHRVTSLYSQIQMQLYGEMKRKTNDSGLLALQIGRILVLLSNLKRLRPSNFQPIHGALLRWMLSSATELAT